MNRMARRSPNGKVLSPGEEKRPAGLRRTTDCEPGFVAIDSVCFPQIPDKSSTRNYLVAIDRATHWAFVRSSSPDQAENSSVDFLRRLEKAAPMAIRAIATDSRCEFTGQDTSVVTYAAGQQRFDLALLSMGIEHRLRSPAREHVKGLVECFVGRLSDIVRQKRLMTTVELDSTVIRYVSSHNHLGAQSALKNRTPIQELESWRVLMPRLFNKRIHEDDGT